MIETNPRKDQTLFQHSKELLQTGYQKSRDFFPKKPSSNFLLGVSVYPILFASQISSQMCLKLLNVETYDNLTDRIDSVYEAIYKAMFVPAIEGATQELFYREFAQSYLLDKKLSVLLSKISPKMGEYPKTTSGTAIRVVLTSVFFTWLLDYRTGWYQSNARQLNSFIFHVFCGAMREKTGSIVPGVALSMARCIIGRGF